MKVRENCVYFYFVSALTGEGERKKTITNHGLSDLRKNTLTDGIGLC